MTTPLSRDAKPPRHFVASLMKRGIDKNKKRFDTNVSNLYEIELELETINEKAVRITVELGSLVLMMSRQPVG